MNNELISTIGLSKIAVPYAFLGLKGDQKILEARHMAIDVLKTLDWIKKPIHFLGMGDPCEFTYYRLAPGLNKDGLLRSTDSCYSILAGMNGVDFQVRNFERIPTPHDYFESIIPHKAYSTIYNNITWMRDKLS